jgi:hypothetical protein
MRQAYTNRCPGSIRASGECEDGQRTQKENLGKYPVKEEKPKKCRRLPAWLPYLLRKSFLFSVRQESSRNGPRKM